MARAVRKQFCEVEQAARILGVERGKLEGWLDGGGLGGTFVRERWLADIHAARRLHARLTEEDWLRILPSRLR